MGEAMRDVHPKNFVLDQVHYCQKMRGELLYQHSFLPNLQCNAALKKNLMNNSSFPYIASMDSSLDEYSKKPNQFHR